MGRFDDFARAPRGPWPPARYAGTVIEEYETSGLFAAIHKTEDKLTQNGDSRNLKLCIAVVNNGEVRNLNWTINYRPEILTPERQEDIRDAQKRYKDVRGAWPDVGLQRDALSLSRFHDLERAGFSLEDGPHGGFVVDNLIGKNAQFYCAVHQMVEGTRDSKSITPEEFKRASDEQRANWFNKVTNVHHINGTGKE